MGRSTCLILPPVKMVLSLKKIQQMDSLRSNSRNIGQDLVQTSHSETWLSGFNSGPRYQSSSAQCPPIVCLDSQGYSSQSALCSLCLWIICLAIFQGFKLGSPHEFVFLECRFWPTMTTSPQVPNWGSYNSLFIDISLKTLVFNLCPDHLTADSGLDSPIPIPKAVSQLNHACSYTTSETAFPFCSKHHFYKAVYQPSLPSRWLPPLVQSSKVHKMILSPQLL